MGNNSNTVERILHAATILFAERGFAETSLRTITGMAEVNLAAVNYHFGSKKELIQAVFARFLTPFCEELDRQLDSLEETSMDNVNLQTVLRCGFKSLLLATDKVNESPQNFMRLLNMGYSQTQEHLREFMVENYSSTYAKFAEMIHKSHSHLGMVEVYWRQNFMLGAAIFSLSSYDSIRTILNTDYNEDTSMEEVIDMLVASMVGMLITPQIKKNYAE